jgi:predicted ribonuclease YlaK
MSGYWHQKSLSLCVVVDTSILMQTNQSGLQILRTLLNSTFQNGAVFVKVPQTVMRELDGIKQSGTRNPEKAATARDASRFLEEYRSDPSDPNFQSRLQFEMIVEMRLAASMVNGLPETNDSRILATCLYARKTGNFTAVWLLTEDRNQRHSARTENIPSSTIRDLQDEVREYFGGPASPLPVVQSGEDTGTSTRSIVAGGVALAGLFAAAWVGYKAFEQNSNSDKDKDKDKRDQGRH